MANNPKIISVTLSYLRKVQHAHSNTAVRVSHREIVLHAQTLS